MLTANSCPFCKTDNACMVSSDQACWCMAVDVPVELIELLADELKNKQCICLSCIEAYKLDANDFQRGFKQALNKL